VIHRELAAAPDADKHPLIECVAALHAALFGRTPAELRASAISRVAAANTVDRITSRRSSDPDANWELVESTARVSAGKKRYRAPIGLRTSGRFDPS
jgi:hypothetical protein